MVIRQSEGKETRTTVYSVEHELRADEWHAADELIEHALNQARRMPEKPVASLELTSGELEDLLQHSFEEIRQHLETVGQRHRVDYFRFWYAVVHGLKKRFELMPMDHPEFKRLQDDAMARNDEGAAHYYFDLRNLHMQNHLLEHRPCVAFLGVDHLLDLDGTPTRLHVQLKEKLPQVQFMKFWHPRNRVPPGG